MLLSKLLNWGRRIAATFVYSQLNHHRLYISQVGCSSYSPSRSGIPRNCRSSTIPGGPLSRKVPVVQFGQSPHQSIPKAAFPEIDVNVRNASFSNGMASSFPLSSPTPRKEYRQDSVEHSTMDQAVYRGNALHRKRHASVSGQRRADHSRPPHRLELPPN